MANVNIRVDDTIKKQVESIFSELGMSLSTATNIFYRQVIRIGGVPFELRVDNKKMPLDLSKMSKEDIQSALQKGRDDFNAGRVFSSEQVRNEIQEYINQ